MPGAEAVGDRVNTPALLVSYFVNMEITSPLAFEPTMAGTCTTWSR